MNNFHVQVFSSELFPYYGTILQYESELHVHVYVLCLMNYVLHIG